MWHRYRAAARHGAMRMPWFRYGPRIRSIWHAEYGCRDRLTGCRCTFINATLPPDSGNRKVPARMART